MFVYASFQFQQFVKQQQQPHHQIQERPICTRTYLVCVRKSCLCHLCMLIYIVLNSFTILLSCQLLPQPSTLSPSLMVRNNLLDKTSFSVWHVALNFYEIHLIRIRAGGRQHQKAFFIRTPFRFIPFPKIIFRNHFGELRLLVSWCAV